MAEIKSGRTARMLLTLPMVWNITTSGRSPCRRVNADQIRAKSNLNVSCQGRRPSVVHPTMIWSVGRHE